MSLWMGIAERQELTSPDRVLHRRDQSSPPEGEQSVPALSRDGTRVVKAIDELLVADAEP